MLISLRGVPEDEAEDIRRLLAENDIEFFETPPGNWGISMPAIWVRGDADKRRAEPLLAAYQRERYLAARAAWRENRNARRSAIATPAWWRALARKILYLAFVAGILYLTLKPFMFTG